MVINVLNQKYRCGSERGISPWESETLLEDLNLIMEWERCGFPFKLKEGGDPLKAEDYEQDREFLGKEPKLKLGDCFYWDKQLYAVDREDRIVLMLSETGAWSGERFLEIVQKEKKLAKREIGSDETISISEVPEVPKGGLTEYVPDYDTLKILRDKYARARYENYKTVPLKLEYTSDNLLFPVTIYWQEWKIWYNPDEIMDEAELKAILHDIFSLIYQKYPRLKWEEPEPEANEAKAENELNTLPI